MPSYFITFHTYGTRLHGDEKGSVDHEHNNVGTPELGHNPRRAEFEATLLKNDPVTLDAERRWVVDRAIRDVCNHRGYQLHAINVRTTHVHVVVSAAEDPPEKVMNSFKAWGTRRMVESDAAVQGIKVWSRHGSTRWLLQTDMSFDRAVKYVLEEQGPDLPRKRPVGWHSGCRDNGPR